MQEARMKTDWAALTHRRVGPGCETVQTGSRLNRFGLALHMCFFGFFVHLSQNSSLSYLSALPLLQLLLPFFIFFFKQPTKRKLALFHTKNNIPFDFFYEPICVLFVYVVMRIWFWFGGFKFGSIAVFGFEIVWIYDSYGLCPVRIGCCLVDESVCEICVMLLADWVLWLDLVNVGIGCRLCDVYSWIFDCLCRFSLMNFRPFSLWSTTSFYSEVIWVYGNRQCLNLLDSWKMFVRQAWLSLEKSMNITINKEGGWTKEMVEDCEGMGKVMVWGTLLWEPQACCFGGMADRVWDKVVGPRPKEDGQYNKKLIMIITIIIILKN